MLDVVGSNLTIFKLATCRNTSQQGGQTHATCRAQQSCDMLRWRVAILWPGLYIFVKEMSILSWKKKILS